MNSTRSLGRWSGPLPQTLYKYYRLNDYSERLFTHSEVYFPSPTAFNDPFDCRVRIDFTSTPDEQIQFLHAQLDRTYPPLTALQRHDMADRILRSGMFFTQDMADAFVAELQASVDRTGVFCLTAVPDNILMWAHYADSHRGFCAEFAIARSTFFAHALDVRYSADYVRPHFQSSPHEQVDAILLTKAEEWSYEREWRIVDRPNGVGVCRYPPADLVSVTLGCYMSPQNRDRIKYLIRQSAHHPELRRAIPRDTQFGLRIEAESL